MEIIMIEWEDACGSRYWEHKEEEIHILPAVSVGIKIRENDKEVEITQSITADTKNHTLAIPLRGIKRIRRLKVESIL